MATYKYTALSHNGQRVSGIMEGFNELDAVDRIKQSYKIILNISEVKEKTGLMNAEIGGNRLNEKAFTVMCSQFAIIFSAGIPIARTVQLIADKTTDKTLKKMLLKVAEDVEAGRTLAASFADHGAKFLPSTFIETIRAGEESGNLDKAFETVYEHFDKLSKMRAKVRGALGYPIFVMVVAVVVVIVLMVKVVPAFTEMFESYDAELPFVTQLLINISNFFKKGWLPMLIIAVLFGIAYKLYESLDEGKLNLAKLQLKIPVLGNISELNCAAQFANTLSTMLASGLTMTRALSITSKTLDNYYISTEVGKITGKLEQGHAMGASLREANVMPDILVDMVGVGEETGEMEQTLRTIGAYYDTELDMAIASALAKLEPALLVGIAIVAGFIVIAMYMAMFSMYSVM